MTHYVLLMVESSVSQNAWIGYHFKVNHEFEHVLPMLPKFGDDIPPFEEVHRILNDSVFEKVEKWEKANVVGWTIEEFVLANGGALTCLFFNQYGHYLRAHRLFSDVTKLA